MAPGHRAGAGRGLLTNLGARLSDALVGRGERRARLRTLTVIRWIAIVGQAFTIFLVHFSLEFPLPLLPLMILSILDSESQATGPKIHMILARMISA